MTPVYSFFKECAGRFKRRVIESPLKVSKKGNIAKYDIDVKDVEKQCGRGDISLMVICNPHNPSGRVWTKETLKALLNICQKNQVLIYSDEILCDLAFLKHSFNTLVSSGYEKVIVCNSISKAFNVSSLRGGYGIIENEGVRKRYMQFATAMNIHTSEITYHCIPVFYRR